jgi:UDP-N-acetyl-2-amino-2-deoxyglucuronate dehydrogenase
LDKVRFGIVGCGVIAPWHARGVTSTEEAELTACCDIIEEKARRLASDFSVPNVYTNYHEMLSSGKVDAVCVRTPSGLHGQVTIDVAKAGKHVMCEKPVEVILAVYESARTGKPVKLPSG